MPEVRVGIPSVIHAALLPRLIGWGRARWLVMTAENIDAPTALAWGLVDVGRAAGRPRCRGRATVKALLECGPEALRSQKALLRQWEELPLTELVNLSVGVFGKSFLTDEPTRLMQGFIDRNDRRDVVPREGGHPAAAALGWHRRLWILDHPLSRTMTAVLVATLIIDRFIRSRHFVMNACVAIFATHHMMNVMQ